MQIYSTCRQTATSLAKRLRVNSQGPATLQGEEGEADAHPLVVAADELVQAMHVVRVHGGEPR